MFTGFVAVCYAARPLGRGVWRQRARATILDALHFVVTPCTRKEALALVDAAYPFGERAMAPYKAWLAERRLFIAAFDEPSATAGMSPDEIGAVEVAIDLVEMKREDDARRLLEAQAPNRHGRTCTACGAKIGQPCQEPEDETAPIVTETAGSRTVDGGSQGPVASTLVRRVSPKMVDRLIPHMARVRPSSGPLFGAP